MYEELFKLIKKSKKRKRKIPYLISLARSGDEDCFIILFEKVYPYVLFLYKKIYIKGYEFDDFIQEASIKLINVIRKYNPDKCGFLKFAKLAIKNHIITISRGENAQKRTILNESLSLFDSWVGDSGNFIKDLMIKEDNLLIWREVSEILTERERDVVFLKIIKEWPYKRIATFIESNEKSVDNALWRARPKIKKKLLAIRKRNGFFSLPFINSGRRIPPARPDEWTEYDPDAGSYWQIGINILEGD